MSRITEKGEELEMQIVGPRIWRETLKNVQREKNTL
jgi:hypothetical protein